MLWSHKRKFFLKLLVKVCSTASALRVQVHVYEYMVININITTCICISHESNIFLFLRILYVLFDNHQCFIFIVDLSLTIEMTISSEK